MVSKTFFAKSVCKKGDHKSANSALGGGTPKTIKKLRINSAKTRFQHHPLSYATIVNFNPCLKCCYKYVDVFLETKYQDDESQ